MKFRRQQAHAEFGADSAAALPAAPGGISVPTSTSAGRAVANFYASLVQTSGVRWVSGGRLQDGEAGQEARAVAAATAAAGAPAEAGPAPPPPFHPATATATAAATATATAEDAGEVCHAGLGSAAARAELEAESQHLQYLQYQQPAGPLQRDQQPPVGAAAATTGGNSHPQQQQQQQQQQRVPPREGVRLGIARSNVGFQLLKKAGWTEGAGLGAQEQGIAEPLEAFQQKGNLGLGYAPKPPPQQGKPPQPQQGAAGALQATGAAAGQQQQPKRPLPEDPLNNEDKATKVKRVRQVLQAEADERAGKAISRYIYAAFNDATGEPTRDSNPLLRRNHKLSATNPLL